MKDDISKASRIENSGYKRKNNSKTVGKLIGNLIDDKKRIDERNERQKERLTTVHEEKGFTSQLTQLGKLCCFVEHFDMIGLDEQNIISVGPFEFPRNTKSFERGYILAKGLIKAGFTEQNYYDFVKYYEDTFNVDTSKHK